MFNVLEKTRNVVLAHPGEHFDVSLFVDGRCKHPIEEIQAAVDSAISTDQAAKLRECPDHIDEAW